MKMKRTIAACAILAAVSLAACTTAEQQAAEKAQRDAYDDRQCQELGFRAGTEAYANCRLKMREIRAKENAGRSNPNFSFGVGVAHGF